MSDRTDGQRARGLGRVAVTGAAGFIGRALCARLQAEGREVVAFDLVAGEVPTTRLDVTDGAAVHDALTAVEPDVVVHLAAITDDRGDASRFQAVNVTGTQNVLDAATTAGARRVVHVSSIAALGFDPGRDAGPDTPLAFDTGSPYFDTKAASEQLARDRMDAGGPEIVVVRPGDVYGPGSGPWVTRPLALMRRGVPVLVDGGHGRMCHAHVDNVVDGLTRAMTVTEAAGGVFTLHDGGEGSLYREYLERLARAGGLAPPRASIPRRLALGLAATAEFVHRSTGLSPPMTRGAVHYVCRQATYSTATSEAVLGWRPQVGLDDGMARLAQTLA